MKTCQNCKPINPDDAVQCDCGYNFSSGKGGLKRGRFLFRPPLVRNIGIALFILSFLAPNDWKDSINCQFFGGWKLFIFVPAIVVQIFTKQSIGSLGQLWSILILVFAWGANFTIFIRPRLVAAIFGIFSISLACFITFPMSHWKNPPCFYLWVLGILIIHLSRFLKPQPKRLDERADALKAATQTDFL
jgi:hypothetical protein